MPTRLEKQKVVCYIVRDGRLLVFKHLDEPWDESGLQVPAGSIKADETPEDAAIREASEETGLIALRLVRRSVNPSTTWLPFGRKGTTGTSSTSKSMVRHPNDGRARRMIPTTGPDRSGSSATGSPWPRVMPCRAVKGRCSALSLTS